MKKLMFVAAAVAASMVAFGDITSQNIVGYQTSNADGGFTLKAPTFTAVGGGDYNIQDFKLGEDAAGDGTEVIQLLDQEGINKVTYTWLNENAGQTPGWYDSDTWAPITEKIPAGNGFLMFTDNGFDLSVSGEVKADATVVQIPKGFKVIGNNTPVDIDIQKMTLPDTAAGDGTEVIQLLDQEGINKVTYTWLNENAGQTPGWYDSDTWAPITATVKAGESFLFYVDADTTVTIPAAIQ